MVPTLTGETSLWLRFVTVINPVLLSIVQVINKVNKIIIIKNILFFIMFPLALRRFCQKLNLFNTALPFSYQNKIYYSTYFINYLILSIYDASKRHGVETGPADQAAVDIRLRQQICGICGFHTPAVLDPDALGQRLIEYL